MSEKSPIQNFYNNTSIFITGASGFLGTALLEKLIRSCPHIKKIYVLMRSKREKSVQQRLDEIFEDHIWDQVAEQNPNYRNVVKIIEGDLTSPKLGISDEDYVELKNEVNVIFNVAATTRLDEPLKRAVKINIGATKYILELGKECRNLKAIVHVSTAYSQCVLQTVKEIFYTPKRDPDELLTYCEEYSEEELKEQTLSILGDHPNTYTFTKGLAESLIKKYENEVPVAVCRPSIVLGCNSEPIEGWAKGTSGVTGLMIGFGFGVIRVLPCNLDATADLIPVDMCVNQMIAVAYETSKQPKKATVYNCVSGAENRIIWRQFWHWVESFVFTYPCLQTMWYYFLLTTTNKKLMEFYQFLLHLIPAHIVDAYLRLTGKEARLVKIYEKVHKLTRLLFLFYVTSWTIENDNTRLLYENLNPKDQKLFPFDVKKIVWDKYLLSTLRYARINILKEPVSNVFVAQKRFVKITIAHYTLTVVFVALIYWFMSFIFKLFM